MHLSVIIPAYNEANRIETTLNSVTSYLCDQPWLSEIIVVNDGSYDHTADVVNSCMSPVVSTRLVSYSVNRGKGFALTRGVREAAGDYILCMDADGSTSIDQIGPFMKALDLGCDLAVASRRLAGSQIQVRQPLTRELLGHAFRFIVSAIVPLGVVDSQAGFKMIRRSCALEYARKQHIYRWAFDVELLALARLRSWRVQELPVIWRNDIHSKVRMLGMIGMLFDVIKIRYYIIRRIYL